MAVRLLLVGLLALLLCSWAAIAVAQDEDYDEYEVVEDDDTEYMDEPLAEDLAPLEINVQRYVEDARLLIEMRRIFEWLEWTVEWNAADRRIDAYHVGDLHLRMWINRREAFVNNKGHVIDVPPRLIYGVTYVPMRYVAEETGCQVDYLGSDVKITGENGRVLIVHLIDD